MREGRSGERERWREEGKKVGGSKKRRRGKEGEMKTYPRHML